MVRHRSRARLKYVAILARTSVASAARVLTRKGHASAEAGYRALDAAEELDYRYVGGDVAHNSNYEC